MSFTLAGTDPLDALYILPKFSRDGDFVYQGWPAHKRVFLNVWRLHNQHMSTFILLFKAISSIVILIIFSYLICLCLFLCPSSAVSGAERISEEFHCVALTALERLFRFAAVLLKFRLHWITHNELVDGVARLKGPSRSIDLVNLLSETNGRQTNERTND